MSGRCNLADCSEGCSVGVLATGLLTQRQGIESTASVGGLGALEELSKPLDFLLATIPRLVGSVVKPERQDQ